MTPDPNPMLGIALHALGGLGAASYYVLFSRVRGWAWETYWLVAGLVFLVVCPWVIAFAAVPELPVLLRQIPESAVITAIALGLGWGVGNLGFGLSLRYLGISLGYCLTLAFCVLFGTLGPPLVKYIAPHSLSNLANQLPVDVLVQKLSGQWTLAGMVVAIVGIGLCGFAGLSKERELSHAAIRARVPDYHFWTGLVVACVAGAMSSCINYAITDTEPISLHLAAEGVDSLWSNSLTMAIFLTSGSVATIGWCIYLNVTNGTLGQYASANGHSLTKNYLWCTLAGMLAYSEFFFYGLAAPNMGKFSFTNLPIHLALVIVFSNVWGIVLAEWRGTSVRTKLCIFAGNAALLLATVLIGRGAFLDQQSTPQIQLEDMAFHQGIAIDIATIQQL